jgi:hypothetical protein
MISSHIVTLRAAEIPKREIIHFRPFGQKDFKSDVLNCVTCSSVTVVAVMDAK